MRIYCKQILYEDTLSNLKRINSFFFIYFLFVDLSYLRLLSSFQFILSSFLLLHFLFLRIVEIAFIEFHSFLVLDPFSLESLSIIHYATVAGVVELVLYFRWSVKGPRSGRLVRSRTWPELGFVVERRLC